MVDRILAIILLLAWQTAMLVLAQIGCDTLVGLALSFLVGCGLIVLMVSAAEQDAPGSDAETELAALLFPMH